MPKLTLMVVGLVALLAALAAVLVTPWVPGKPTVASVGLIEDLEPGSTEIPVWVTYSGCAGGRAPEGIEEVRISEDAETVTITVIVRRPPYAPLFSEVSWECPGNDGLRQTIELSDPVQSRTVSVVSPLNNARQRQLWPRP